MNLKDYNYSDTFILENMYSGGFLGGNENFQKHMLTLDWFTPTISKFILFNSIKLGVIKPLDVGNNTQSFVPPHFLGQPNHI